MSESAFSRKAFSRNESYARRTAWAAALLVALAPLAAAASKGEHWITTWLASPCPPVAGRVTPYENQTLRVIVHTSLGGSRARVRFSNAFGTKDLAIGAATIALQASGAAVADGSLRSLTFSGETAARIPPGALLLSDPVDLAVPAQGNLAISLYLPNTTEVSAIHYSAAQNSYIAAGNVVGEKSLTDTKPLRSWPFVMGVEVSAPEAAGVVVAFGDSITDGGNSTVDTNRRWPNRLSERLASARSKLAVVDAGIGGNRILHDGAGPMGGAFGHSALSRFDRDVLAQPGVRYVIVLEGINDIGHPGMANIPASEEVSAKEIIAGLRQLIDRAHAKRVKIFGATLTPFEGTTISGYFTPEKEAKRVTVNQWIRTGGAFDGVVDFEKAVADPAHPTRMLPAFDSGDHLHPNDAGYKAMGDAVSLALFKK